MKEHIDKVGYVLTGALILMVTFLVFIIGMLVIEKATEKSCRDFGKFSAGDTMYECRQIRPEAP